MSVPAVPGADAINVEGIEKKVAEAKEEVEKAKKEAEKAKEEVEKAEKKVEKAKEEVEKALEKVKKAGTDIELKATANLFLKVASEGLQTAQDGVKSAQDGVKSAQKVLVDANDGLIAANKLARQASQRLLDTTSGAAGGAQAASGQGVRLVLPPEPQGLAEPGSNEEDIQKSMSLDALSKLLKRNRTGGAIGKYKQLSDILGKNCLDVWGQNCAMSHLPPDEGLTHNLAHIIPQAALKQEHTIYPVSKDLRRSINGGIFSTLNVLPMHPTIEQWFDAGFFCVQASGEIVMNERLSNDSSLRMAPWLPTYVSEKIRRSGPLMAAFKWHKENVFTTPGGVRAMFGGSSTSSAKGSGAGESQQGSHSREGGGSAASGGKSSGNSRGHENRVGTAGPPRTTLSACGLDLLKSLEAIVGLSAHDKVLLWDVGEAETVRANYDEPN